jgi:hypothetical protein
MQFSAGRSPDHPPGLIPVKDGTGGGCVNGRRIISVDAGSPVSPAFQVRHMAHDDENGRRHARRSSETPATDDIDLLTIAPVGVCFVIVKAREFDVKDAVTEPDPGSNPSDDASLSVLEDHADDPVVQELTSFIGSLSIDEQIDLVALAWLGRDDYGARDWPSVRAEAAAAHNERTAEYLLGMPLLADFLEEGFSLLGYSCEEFETGRL